MTRYFATHSLRGRSGAQNRANLICYMVNKRAIFDDFTGDQERVREMLNEVAEPELQRNLEISVVPVDVGSIYST